MANRIWRVRENEVAFPRLVNNCLKIREAYFGPGKEFGDAFEIIIFPQNFVAIATWNIKLSLFVGPEDSIEASAIQVNHPRRSANDILWLNITYLVIVLIRMVLMMASEIGLQSVPIPLNAQVCCY
jgi:hypothetical protein